MYRNILACGIFVRNSVQVGVAKESVMQAKGKAGSSSQKIDATPFYMFLDLGLITSRDGNCSHCIL